MSDWSGKSKPLLERIGSLSGRSPGLSLTPGGGTPEITDQDIASAVAMARQTKQDFGERYPSPRNECVRPELLLLKWGMRPEFVPAVARACSAAMATERGIVHAVAVPLNRCASVMAAQMLGGRAIGPESIKHAAWSLDVAMLSLEHEIGAALAWMQTELTEAERAYTRWLSRRNGDEPEQRCKRRLDDKLVVQ